ncbi:MAG: addiction module protein [Cyclobacteriaceae bacterium]
MKITLDIKDSQFDTFLNFIETLDYVSVDKNQSIPKWQQDETNRRLELVSKGEMPTRNWSEVKEEIFKK